MLPSKCPVAPGDPLIVVKTFAWHVLRDAVAKSCLSNEVSGDRGRGRGRIATSMEMIRLFVDSREWFAAMDGRSPGEPDGEGMETGFGAGFCLDLFGIGRDEFISKLEARWSSLSSALHDALSTKERAILGAIEAQRKALLAITTKNEKRLTHGFKINRRREAGARSRLDTLLWDLRTVCRAQNLVDKHGRREEK